MTQPLIYLDERGVPRDPRRRFARMHVVHRRLLRFFAASWSADAMRNQSTKAGTPTEIGVDGR